MSVGGLGDALSVLYSIPIALIAVELGAAAGLAAGGLAFGLFALWATLADAGAGPLGYLARGAVFVFLGGVIGYLADTLRTSAREVRALYEGTAESDRLRTALLRTMSHDFRSPLTAIIATGELMGLQDVDAATRRELSSIIVSEGRRLERFADKLLAMSRLAGGAATPRPQSCSVDEILDAAVRDAATDGVRFEVRGSQEAPAVDGDPEQLERAFANLLENAARFADDATVDVSVVAMDDRVRVHVSNRGLEIPEEHRERIFEPFHQLERGQRGYRGSGLGLAIARGFVESNGGRVWLESPNGTVTTFVVELPGRPSRS
jgi:two-component system sensor histidine kinase KdpD